MLAARAWERYCGSASLVSLPRSSKPGVTFFSALAQWEREHGLGPRTAAERGRARAGPGRAASDESARREVRTAARGRRPAAAVRAHECALHGRAARGHRRQRLGSRGDGDRRRGPAAALGERPGTAGRLGHVARPGERAPAAHLRCALTIDATQRLTRPAPSTLG